MRTLTVFLVFAAPLAALAQFTTEGPQRVEVTGPGEGPVTVSGSVQATAPDGGLRVTLGSDVVPVSGAVSASVTGSVTALPPDGGLRVSLGSDTVNVAGAVSVSGTVGVSSLPPVTGTVDIGTMPSVAISSIPHVSALITNSSSEPVPVYYVTVPTVALQNGTQVSLSSTSLDSITAANAERVCTYGTPVVVAAMTTTSSATPASPLTGRTEITFTNLQTDSRELWCRVGSAPTSTNAIVMKAGVTMKLSITDAQTVNCACSQSTCRINYVEAACTHP